MGEDVSNRKHQMVIDSPERSHIHSSNFYGGFADRRLIQKPGYRAGLPCCPQRAGRLGRLDLTVG